MKLNTTIRAAAVATGMVVAGLSLTTPASADTYCGSFCIVDHYVDKLPTIHYQAQVDNNPGNGAASWIWVWSSGLGDHVDYYLNGDGSMHKLYSPFADSASKSLSKDVTAFRVCGPNGFGADTCSDWHHPQY
jgi:hypothetical protein